MKCTNEELNKIWPQLEEIFNDFKRLKKSDINKLEKLGFIVNYNGKHPKITWLINNELKCVTLSSSPSDNYAGRQILRQIRAMYDRGFYKC